MSLKPWLNLTNDNKNCQKKEHKKVALQNPIRRYSLLYSNKEENAHIYAVMGGGKIEKEMKRERERLCQKHKKVDTKILQEIMT